MSAVFISYRQIDDAQRQRVRDFAERVRGGGINVVLDQFYKDANPGGPPEGWPKWSRAQAINSERVLVIGNAPWFRCFDGTEKPGVGLGAACEAHNLNQRLYDDSYVNAFMRVVYFEKADVADISHDLKGYDRFHADDDFDAIIAWLAGPAPLASPSPATLAWPPRCPAFILDMANRHDEFAFFADTLCGTAPERGTLISAGTDHGKTRLVSEFHRYGCEVLGADACSLVDFKARGTTDNLLDTIASDLGGRIPGLGDRSPSRLREGLRKATRPVLFVFDTFERATKDAREFVESHFLAEMGRASAMRILLAGQPDKLPDPAKAAWRAYARRFNLGSIPDPKPWVDWSARAFPQIPANVVAAIAVSAGGAPGAIANQLATLGSFNAAQLKALGIQ